MPIERGERSDFFVSRRGSVASIAREVADVLTEHGYKVLVQDYDIPLGASFIEAMHEAVKNSRDLIVLFTHDYETSPYTRKEFTTFEAERAQSAEERHIVVLRCEDVPLRGLLADNVYQDLVGIIDPEERRRRIIAAAEGRSQAKRPPPRPFIGVPPRNLDFTARRDELDRLDNILLRDTRAAVTQSNAPSLLTPVDHVALSGMGGVGKTSLATEYAHRYRGLYSGVCWCHSETRTALIFSLAALAPVLGLPATNNAALNALQDAEAAARAGLRKLSEVRGRWLLIYDNVTSPEDIADLLPPGGAQVLITSRFSDWSGWAEEVAIGELPLSEAVSYLQRRTARVDPAGAKLLAQHLGCLPLALEHAGAWCKDGGLSFEEYRTRANEMIRLKPRGSRYPASVFATASLAYDAARAKCPDSERLMHILAFLAPENMTVDMIGPSVMDVLARTAATAALTELSIIKLTARNEIIVHRVMQEVIRDRFHASTSYATISPALHDTLQYTFALKAPKLLSPMWYHLLWGVHHDPEPNASISISYYLDAEKNLEINLECTKTVSGAKITAQVLAHEGQLHWKVYGYSLAEEWKLVDPPPKILRE